MKEQEKAKRAPDNNNLFQISFVESGMMRMNQGVPKDYLFRMLANRFTESLLEKMEVSSQKDWNDPYAVRHVASVFIAKPSEVFEHRRVSPNEEVVVLDYKGFTRRIVTDPRRFEIEVMDLPPMNIFDISSTPDEPIKYEKLKFVDRGMVNAIGERVFQWQPPVKKRNNE